MMAPWVYRDARMAAPNHIQAKIIGRTGPRLQIEVVRAFRGALRPGTELTIFASLPPDGPPMPGGTIYTDAARIDAARYVEAFLDDEREVVRDQIKFLSEVTDQPNGDPSLEGFLW
jgi:hypothetical protein